MKPCDEAREWMADALGGELRPADRRRFEAHLKQCETCRREYDELREVVERMRELSGPVRAQIHVSDRGGGTIVISPVPTGGTGGTSQPRRGRSSGWWLRYAAAVALGFLAGYAFSGGRTVREDVPASDVTKLVSADGRDAGTQASTRKELTLEEAVARAYMRHPGRSNLETLVSVLARIP
ncbi:MAG: hypothetical protein D6788_08970 [Planctomycetota bacterium]|nr:MAG: hypothetical protein D6788_08970 [Planctomycetota bacterium]